MYISEKKMLQEVNKMAAEAFHYYKNNGEKYDANFLIYRSEIRGALRIMSVITGNYYSLNEDGTISKS